MMEGEEGAKHFRQCHAQECPTHTHLWLSPPGFVQGRLLDEGSGEDEDGQKRMKGRGGGGE